MKFSPSSYGSVTATESNSSNDMPDESEHGGLLVVHAPTSPGPHNDQRDRSRERGSTNNNNHAAVQQQHQQADPTMFIVQALCLGALLCGAMGIASSSDTHDIVTSVCFVLTTVLLSMESYSLVRTMADLNIVKHETAELKTMLDLFDRKVGVELTLGQYAMKRMEDQLEDVTLLLHDLPSLIQADATFEDRSDATLEARLDVMIQRSEAIKARLQRSDARATREYESLMALKARNRVMVIQEDNHVE